MIENDQMTKSDETWSELTNSGSKWSKEPKNDQIRLKMTNKDQRLQRRRKIITFEQSV